MKIVLDDVLDTNTGAKIGELFIDTNLPPPMHPTLGRQAEDWKEWLVAMNASPAARAAGGWGAAPKTAAPGQLAQPSLWARLVAAVTAPDADPEIAALNLSGT